MIEQDTRFIIDNNLINKGWVLDINNPSKNVFFESDILRILDNEELKKCKKRPDYILFDLVNKKPIGVIEAKAGGKNLEKALDQATEYAKILDAPLIFAMNNGYCQTRHLHTNQPLYINENEVVELIRQKDALKFLNEDTNSIYTIPKEIILSRQELITIFKSLNNTLRGEGLRAGIERLSEFANILFLKLFTENKGENIWQSLKKVDNSLLIDSFNSTLVNIEKEYGASIFTGLQIKKPETLRQIINKLDKLVLSAIDSDIKGDAFEYFLQQATASGNDLGEYFTPRHITKTLVNLANPKFKETVYDPFCGTGGFLTQAFNHIKDNAIIKTKKDLNFLTQSSIFGSEITSNARLAKMNMILHGDGHSGVEQQDTLENPVFQKYDVVITNMPFSQTTKFSYLYQNNLAKDSGDGVCMLHCFQAVKKGGRMALVVPEGVLFRSELEEVRRYLLLNSKLQTIISLPRESFVPYAKVKTYILYFIDCHKSKTTDRIWHFEVENDGFSRDNHRRKIKQNDLRVIDGINFSSKVDIDSIAGAGFSQISMKDVEQNNYILNFSQYSDLSQVYGEKNIKIRDFLALSDNTKVGDLQDIPIMSITMSDGLVDQQDKFKRRIASLDISKYKRVYKNELVVGFPIDEGVLGFQKKYEIAAVSPAYKIWKIIDKDIDIDFIDILFRSSAMRLIYKSKMQGSADRRRNIPDEIFLDIEIPIPDLQTQKEIVKKYNKIQKQKLIIKQLKMDIETNISSMWEDN
jgi:type I restriction enzyme M protein